MNIGVNARLLTSDKFEGIQRYIYETTFRMASVHPEDQFYLFFDRKVHPAFVFPENVHCIVIPLQARHFILWHIWFEYLLPFYLKKYKIDVLYSGDTYLSLNTRVPTLLVCHDLAYIHYPEHIPSTPLFHYRHFFPKYHQKAKHIIAVSEATKSDIIRQFGTDPSKISIGYNAADLKLHPLSDEVKIKVKAKLTGGHPYIFYLGSLHPRKNIIRLIEAFKVFKKQHKSDYKLVLAGRMAWKSEEIEYFIKDTPDVLHIGMIDDNDKKKVLGAADLMVYVSLFEGFGIPLIEAMAAGVPVVSSSVSSMPEVAGDAAILCNPFDIADIAEAISKGISDNLLRQKLIEKGLERVHYFDWNRTAEIIYLKLTEIKVD
ncbi:MAG: glycosyltransferase family 4 protein [Saprospiraceae bacterium]|nr:glycosyltransferase family 4 protein [Saprospiraceae bacterium]